VIDMHVHASERADLALDTSLADRDVTRVVTELGERLAAEGASSALVILMDIRFPDRPDALDRLPDTAAGVRLQYCQLMDFRAPDVERRLDALAARGVAAIKFHPYLQNVRPDELPLLAFVAGEAARRGMFVVVDGEYGSAKLFEIRPAEVVLKVAQSVTAPVLFAHGGGAAVLDGLQVAEACPNVFLDLSFSLWYWGGSSVEPDFAFAIRKLGTARWFYGSDAPFVPLRDARQAFDTFMARHGFAEEDSHAILHRSATRFWDSIAGRRGQTLRPLPGSLR
jgi:hypothetical protein